MRGGEGGARDGGRRRREEGGGGRAAGDDEACATGNRDRGRHEAGGAAEAKQRERMEPWHEEVGGGARRAKLGRRPSSS